MLSPGFYWVDIFGEESLQAFFAWAKSTGAKVRKSAQNTEDPAQRTWLLFELKGPAEFLDITKHKISKPTKGTAQTDINDSGGADLKPDVLDQLADKVSVDNLASGIATTAQTAGIVGAVALGLWLLLKRK